MLFLHANISRRTLCSPDSSYPFNSLKISSSNSDRSSRFGTSQMIHRFARELSSCWGLSWPMITRAAFTWLLSISLLTASLRFCLPSPSYTADFKAWKITGFICVSLYSSSMIGIFRYLSSQENKAAGVPEFRLNAGASGDIDRERME